jgi:hypothetical protein
MDDASLHELQHWMAAQLRRRRDLTRDAETTALAARYFTGNDRLSPVEQLEIYREQFWLRHTSSLVEDFPGLGAIVGQHAWERLVEEYLETYIPDCRSLRDLGRKLPDFVESCTWLEHRALCADMARLEWAYVELFDAPDAHALSPQKLSSIPPDAWQRARLVLNPALRLLEVQYPVAELRRRVQETGNAGDIPLESSRHLVLYRSLDRAIQNQAITAGAFELLRALGAGIPLVPACEAAMAAVPLEATRIEAKIGEWFQRWGEQAWIIDVLIDDPPA